MSFSKLLPCEFISDHFIMKLLSIDHWITIDPPGGFFSLSTYY